MKYYLKYLFASLSLGFLVSCSTQHSAQLILDMPNVDKYPRNFRTSSDHVAGNINKRGLTNLHMAGGSQFSAFALQKIIKRLHAKHLTIIDLRQESHGFLNGNAISWYGPQDAANANKSNAAILRDETEKLAQLKHSSHVVVNKILNKTPAGYIGAVQPIEMTVETVDSERALVTNHHLQYERIYVQDFHAPTPKEVDQFIAVFRQLSPINWVYFHCHAGVGRTTTFMAMYDMLRNAKVVSFADILARQHALGGKELTQLPSPKNFKYAAANKRIAFLEMFYRYARDNHDAFETSWTAYIKENN